MSVAIKLKRGTEAAVLAATLADFEIAFTNDTKKLVVFDGTNKKQYLPADSTELAEVISDVIGSMVGSNTETMISVSYDDADNTLDFVIDATATPTASKIPIADGSGKLAAGWGGSASTLATLNASVKVVEDPANATATPTASKIPIADGSGKLAAGWGGAASTLATLNSSSKVVEEPASKAQASGIASLDANSLVVQNPASFIISITAGEAISQYDLLYANYADLGKYYVASNEDELTYDVVAIALANISSGNTGLVQIGVGSITNVGWSFTPGKPLYLGTDGAITEDITDIEWIKSIGNSITATQINFAPQLGYNVNDPIVEIIADALEVSYSPVSYTPALATLAGHIAAIDALLANHESRLDAHSI
jgi:hypothetical protein